MFMTTFSSTYKYYNFTLRTATRLNLVLIYLFSLLHISQNLFESQQRTRVQHYCMTSKISLNVLIVPILPHCVETYTVG